jgi:Leucine-rich repeat (LRR) protein
MAKKSGAQLKPRKLRAKAVGSAWQFIAAQRRILEAIGAGGLKLSDLSNLSELPVELASLTVLRSLDLGGTRIRDLAPLAGLIGLHYLDLSATPVSDLAPLAGLNALQTLFLNGTQVSDLAPLAGLNALRFLYLNDTRVSNLAPLAGNASLECLHLDGTQVSDLRPIARITRLQEAAVENANSPGIYGLMCEMTPASRESPFDVLALLGQPARTVETINELRRQQGMPEHIPEGYEPPADISVLLATQADERDKRPPRIPVAAPAAIEPILSKGRISLPADAAATDLSEDTRDAALSALKTDLGELATDVEGEANIDHRVAKLLRDVAALVPQSGPPQDVLFRLAHKEEVLVAYAPTVNNEWPQVLASRYHVVCRQFDRTMRQFPKWREFKRNAAKDQLAPEQLAQAAPIAQQAIDALADKSTEPFVDPKVPQSLEQLAAPLQPQQHAAARDIIEASKELLVEDVVESINNILKRVAEVALAAGLTGKEAGAKYAKGLAKGFIEAAKKQGPKDGAALLKWARRFLVGSGGTAAAVAFIQRLVQTFPEKFAWLEAVVRFLSQ